MRIKPVKWIPPYFYLGNITKAQIHFEQAVDLYDFKKDSKIAFRYTIHPIIHCLSFLSWTYWLLGYPEKAFQTHQKAVTLAHKIDHTFSLAVALTMGTWLHSYSRDIIMTQKVAETTISLSKEKQFKIQTMMGTFLKNWALAMQNKGEKTITRMCDAITTHRAAGSGQPGPILFARLSEAYAKFDKIDQAIDSIIKANELLNKSNERFWESEVMRLKGELTLLQTGGNQSEAESYLQKALNFSRRQKAKSLELRAAMSLSRLWQSQGKIEEARSLLAEIYNWFTEGFETADLKDAKALLDELS